MAAGLKLFFVVLVVISVTIEGKWVGAQMHHHMVGGDRGWDSSSDLGSWSSGRIFRVGDNIWFSYSAAQENIVELKSSEEYLSCDVTNPIKMYTDGLNKISLEEEGIRYFASGNLESCNSGLKLHVDVQPREKNGTQTLTIASSESTALAMAAGPTASVSTQLNGLSYVLFIGLLFCYMGL